MNGHASINKAFRLVWSEARGAYTVVPESARGQGKTSRSASHGAVLAAALLLPLWGTSGHSLAQQTVQLATGTANAYVSANGVPVVNIAAPNSAGLSHNQYNRYDVQANGLVLNNSSAVVQSQLAGMIAGNANLGASAKVILNEVVTNNRSHLAGFTEVAGAKAAVIVANPYGITCDGCGFYNTDRVTLSTGTPTFLNGQLSGFNVTGGDVLIGGNGLDASAQQLLDIVTRSVKIEGAIKTAANGLLGITVGANEWNYGTREATASSTPGGIAPSYAIDASALGGMYAGQIRLIATEQGVGVRVLGEAAASAGDFTLSAAGKVELHAAKVSAERDLSLTTTSNANDALALTDASLSAKGNLALSAAGGGAVILGGALVAGNELTGTLKSLDDAATTTQTLPDNNTRYGKTVLLNVSGDADISGTAWGAQQALTVNAASLASSGDAARLFAGATLDLTAATGGLQLGASQIQAVDDVHLTAQGGQIAFAAGGGAQSTAGDVSLVAGAGVDNAGVITADQGSLSIQAHGGVSNSGTLNAKTALSLAHKTVSDTGVLTNTATGKVLSDGSLSFGLSALDNSGAVQAADAVTFNLTSFTNQAGASVLAGTRAGQGATFIVDGGAFDNQGLLQTAGALNVTAASITNGGSARLLTLKQADGGSDGAVNLTANTVSNAGVIDSGGTLSATATATTGTGDSFTNSGVLQSVGDMALSVGRQMTNATTGQVVSGADLTLTSSAAEFNVINDSLLQSARDMRIGQNENGNVHLANLTMEGLYSANKKHQIISGSTLNLSAKSMKTQFFNSEALIQARKGLEIDTETWTGSHPKVVASTEVEKLGFRNRIHIAQDAQWTAWYSAIYSYGDFFWDAAAAESNLTGIKSETGAIYVTAKRLSGKMDAATDFIATLGLGKYQDTPNELSINAGRDLVITTEGGSITDVNGTSEGAYLRLPNAQASRDVTVGTPGGAVRLDYRNLVAGRKLTLGSEGHFVRRQGGSSEESYLGAGDTMSIFSDRGWQDLGTIEAANQLVMKVLNFDSIYRHSRLRIIFSSNANTTLTSSLTYTGAATNGYSIAAQLYSAGDLNLLVKDFALGNAQRSGVGSIASAKSLTITADGDFENNGSTLYAGAGLTINATGNIKNNIASTLAPEMLSDDAIHITAGGEFINQSGDAASILAKNGVTISANKFTNETSGKIISNSGDVDLTYTVASANKGLISAAHRINLNSGVALTNTGTLRATAISGSGNGGLTNSGSPQTSTIAAKSTTGGSAAAPTTVSATTPLSAVTPQTVVLGGKITFGGFSITLPSKPNGYFVISKNPNSRFLVETNPLYVSGASLGSDYLMSRFGIDPEKAAKRLGDDNYEAYLVRQQLIEQTGANVLKGYGNEHDQIQRLMDQAYNQGQQGGFVFGQSLTPEQIAGLTQDIVWMETINVGGEPVIVPRVYLAQSTRDMITTGGGTIMAETIELDGGLTNKKGGTIVSSGQDLTITTKGDLENQGGTIRSGGKLDLSSTEGNIANRGGTIRSEGDLSLTAGQGNIINETLTQTDRFGDTRITGDTGTIGTGGNLSMEAGKDITVKGANITASGDASLKAGENITFDTIVETTKERERKDGKSVVTTTNTNVGSTLDVGGNLSLDSGKDTTLAGSDATVGGNLNATTGGNFEVISRQDSVDVTTRSSKAGFGVGGGLFGSTQTVTNDFTGTNAKSTLTVGGDATVKSTGQTVIQGSDVAVEGNARIDAKEGIAVLDRQDEKRSTSRTTTTTFFSSESSSGSGSGSESQSGSKGRVGSAGAGGSSQAEAGADFNLMKTTTTVTNATVKTSVGSNLEVGGNLDLTSQGTVTVQGSNVAAGNDLKVDAKNVEVLTGRNETTSTTTTNSTALGLFTESGADASGSANATAQARGPLGTDVKAGAEGSANAEATATFGFKTTSSVETSSEVTNTSSSLTSGGNMKINANQTATFQGATVSSGGNMEIEAKDIRNLAAQDTTKETSSSETQMGGIYLGGSAGAEGSAKAGASASQGTNSSGGGEAGVELAAGLRYKNTQSSEESGTTTQVTNTFTSGGNFTRKATDTIVDQGTQVDAGGNITQSAREIRDEAISDSSSSSNNSQSHDARVGMTVEAEVKGSTTQAAESGTGMGGKATYAGEISSESERETTAVTSSFKAGGSISSTSTDKTTLVGTQFEAKGDVNLQAGSLEYKAAADTTSSSGSSHTIEAEISVSADEVGAKGGYGLESSSDTSSTSRAGAIKAGGNLTITTQGNTTLEGTDLSAGGSATIKAGGDLEIKAARDTSSSSATSVSVEGEGGVSRENGDKNGKMAAEGSYESSRSDQARVGTFTTQGNLTISSGGNATLEGTQITSGGSAVLEAGGSVKQQNAVSTSSEVGVSGGVRAQTAETTPEGASADKRTTTRAAQGEGSVGTASSSTTTGTRVDAVNGVVIRNNAPAARAD